jgi:hypothetical protein
MKAVALDRMQFQACSKWVHPSHGKILPITFTIPFFFAMTAGQNYEGVEQALSTPGKYSFKLRAIGAYLAAPGPLVRFQWPNGRYLSNLPIPVFSYIGTGKRGRLIDPPIKMEDSDVIRMDIDNSSGGTQQLAIFFEGVVLVPFEASF